MTLLSAGQLARIRAALAAAMPDDVVVQRRTETDDGLAGVEWTWAAVWSGKGSIAPSGDRPEERAIAERLESLTTWTVALPYGTDVVAADRIGIQGGTYEVLAVLGPRTHQLDQALLVALAKTADGGTP